MIVNGFGDTYAPGDTGAGVQSLQAALVAKGFSVGSSGTDGIYGSDTEAAVKAFQQANGLTATGIVDVATWAALMGQPKSSISTGAKVAIGGGIAALIIGAFLFG